MVEGDTLIPEKCKYADKLYRIKKIRTHFFLVKGKNFQKKYCNL